MRYLLRESFRRKKKAIQAFGLAALMLFLAIVPADSGMLVRAENTKMELSGYAVKVNDVELTPDTELSNGDLLKISFDWVLDDSDRETLEFEADITPLESIVLVNCPETPLTAEGYNQIGVYSIQNNVFRIKLFEDTQFLKDDNRNGWANIDGKVNINEDDFIQGENIDYKIGTVTGTFKLDKKTSSMSVSKWTEGKTVKGDDGKYYQTYRVNLKAHDGDITNVQIQDDFGDKLTNMSEWKVIESNCSGVDKDVNYSDISAVNAALADKTLKKDQSITFEYKMQVDSTIYQQEVVGGEFQNKVTADYTNNKDEKDTKESSQVNVNVNRPSLTKSEAGYNSDTGEVTWEIKISMNDLKTENFASVVGNIKDVLGTGFEAAGTVQNLTPADFVPQGDGVYVYTYTAKVEEEVKKSIHDIKVTNKVNMDIMGMPYEATGEYTVKGDPSVLKKTQVGYDKDKKLITWNITIDTERLPDNLEYFTLIDRQEWPSGVPNDRIGNHEVFLTNSIIKVDGWEIWNGSAVPFWGQFFLHNGQAPTQYYTLDIPLAGTYLLNQKQSGKDVVVTITTRVTDDELANKTYYNGVYSKYKVNGTEYSTPKVYAEWKDDTIKANALLKAATQVKNSLEYTVLVNTWDISNFAAGKNIVLEDILPENMKYDEGTFEIVDVIYQSQYYTPDADENWYYNAGVNKTTGSVEAKTAGEQQKLVITIPVDNNLVSHKEYTEGNGYKLQLKVKYTTTIKDAKAFLQEGKTQNFTNNVTGKYGDEKIGDASVTTQMTPAQIVKKVGTYNETTAPNVNYSIEVNEQALDLSAGDTLTATDQLGEKLAYDLNTLKIYKNVNGNWVELARNQYSYTRNLDNNSMTLTFPDAMYLKIEYQAVLQLEVGDDVQESDIFNKFSLSGVDSSVGEENINTVSAVIMPSVGANANRGVIRIWKYWGESNSARPLDGCTFAVYETTKEGNQYSVDKTKLFKSGINVTEEGIATIVGLETDKVYALVETKAKEGYQLNEEPYYFVVLSDDSKAVDYVGTNASPYEGNGYAHPFRNYPNDGKSKLELAKVVSGERNWNDIKSNISFTITGPDSYNRVVTGNEMDANGTILITDLQPGAYKITETTKNVAGYTCTTTYQINTGSAVTADTTSTIILVADQKTSVTFNNTYALEPTPAPSATPTVAPSATPTVAPSATPTVEPSATPTVAPSATPTVEPSATPTVAPSATPTVAPSATPTVAPSATPTVAPSATPTVAPSATPTVVPTATPTVAPSATPTVAPSATPTVEPSATPTVAPSATPTVEPSATPTVAPSATPTVAPSATPTVEPSATPTVAPSATPTVAPSATPTVEPSATPTVAPSATPTVAPSATPTVAPSATPTVAPTATPTVAPSATPTVAPSATPTVAPTATPTVAPSATPTAAPSATPTVAPSATPTVEPSATPTVAPTATPTVAPSATPTAAPSATPTVAPTATPTVAPTATPTVEPSATPTVEPSATPMVAPSATPTVAPSATPTVAPSATPTVEPSATPTVAPSATPTVAPTATPTVGPSATPTIEPSATPTVAPSATPTVAPSAMPTVAPTATPTVAPTATPTVAPTATPTVAPTATPTVAPTATPTVAPTQAPAPTPAPTVEPTPTPVITAPKTGDDTPLVFWKTMMIIGASGMLFVVACAMKREYNRKK